MTQKFSKLYLLNSANISSKFWVPLKKDRIAESYWDFFILLAPCFHKSAKVSVMNAPYKHRNNSDLLFMVLAQKKRSFSKYSSTSPLISLHMSRLSSFTWSKMRPAKCGNLLQNFSIAKIGNFQRILKFNEVNQNLPENWVSKQSFFVLILTKA